MSISRPASVFSSDFHSNILEEARFVSKAERSSYKKIKEDVQNSFLLSKESVFVTEFAIVDPENSGYSHGVTRKILKTFQDNIEKSGLSYESSKEFYTDNGMLKVQIRVSLPEADLDESRPASPGWNEAFRGSVVKKDFQEQVYRAYETTTKKIQSGILNNKDVAFHVYEVDRNCPVAYRSTVTDWLVKDLEEEGKFKVSACHNGHRFSIKISKPD